MLRIILKNINLHKIKYSNKVLDIKRYIFWLFNLIDSHLSGFINNIYLMFKT